MRKLTFHRKWSIMGCALKVRMSVILPDKTTDCGRLKNGKEISVDIPDTDVTVILTVCSGASRFTVPAGTCDVRLLARPRMDPSDPFIITEVPDCDFQKKTCETASKKSSDDLRLQVNQIIAKIHDYMDECEGCGYTENDIKQLEEILLSYLSELKNLSVNNDDEIKQVVKKTVLEINELYKSSHYCMIETDEREDICTLMIDAAVAAGYSISDEDITEEWREW